MQTADYTVPPLRQTVRTHMFVKVHILEHMCLTTNTTEGDANLNMIICFCFVRGFGVIENYVLLSNKEYV